MAQWCKPVTLQPEQSGGVGSRRGRASPLERHDKGSRTRLAQATSANPALDAKNGNFTFIFTSHFENGEKCDGQASRSHVNGTFLTAHFENDRF